MRFQVRYQRPYSNEWFSQFFKTLEEAQRMNAFYLSCGAPSHITATSLAQLER